MKPLLPCAGCGRHVRAGASCPFCGAADVSRRALHLVGGAVTTIVLAACYGTGGFYGEVGPDWDRDGFPAEFDCDDEDAEVNPDAVELCTDGKDNDCNGLIDELDSDCVNPWDTDATDDTDG